MKVGGIWEELSYDRAGNRTRRICGEEELYQYDRRNRLTAHTRGGVTREFKYDNAGNRFKFNGQQYDPVTQQYYLCARYYNPVIGRFTQEDTYRGDGLNLLCIL